MIPPDTYTDGLWAVVVDPASAPARVGAPSMIADAVDGALRLARRDRLVTVIVAEHRRRFDQALGCPAPGLLLEQPRDCGSAAAVLLALAYVLERDPEATVVVFAAEAESRGAGPGERKIVRARAATLWELGRRFVPDMVRRFGTLRQVLRLVLSGSVPREHETLALTHVYQALGRADFALDILHRPRESALALSRRGSRGTVARPIRWRLTREIPSR